jgi:hypothetical protein
MSQVASRRAVLAGIAAAPAAALPALAADKAELSQDELGAVIEALRCAADINHKEAERIGRRIETIKADPIFAAIEDHRQANAAYIAACDSDPEDKDEATTNARMDEHVDALATFLSTKPTTIAGCAAALAYAQQLTDDDDGALFETWMDEISQPASLFLGNLAAALRGAAS